MTTKVIRSLLRLALDYLEELAYWLDPAHFDADNARNRLQRLRGVLVELQKATSATTTNATGADDPRHGSRRKA